MDRAWGIAWRWLLRDAPCAELIALSAIAGLAAGFMLTAVWGAVADIGPYLAILLAAAAVATCAGLRAGEGSGADRRRAVRSARAAGEVGDAPGQLLARMHHELRTPLNAVIGFSEAMQHELHGPLGNARYQQYAAHITESGGRLLKASEDALAVAATMSTLAATRTAPRRDRVPAAALIEAAWAALGTSAQAARLRIDAGAAAVAIDCDRQATGQALQHLLAEAAARAGSGGTIIASGAGSEASPRIEVLTLPAWVPGRQRPPLTAGDGVRLMLIRSLLGMQEATLRVEPGQQAGAWLARVAFAPPARRWGQRRRPGSRRPAGRAPATGAAVHAAMHVAC